MNDEKAVNLLRNEEELKKAVTNDEVSFGRYISQPRYYLLDRVRGQQFVLVARAINEDELLLEIGLCSGLSNRGASDLYVHQRYVTITNKAFLLIDRQRAWIATEADKRISQTVAPDGRGYSEGEFRDSIETILDEVANDERIMDHSGVISTVMDPV